MFFSRKLRKLTDCQPFLAAVNFPAMRGKRVARCPEIGESFYRVRFPAFVTRSVCQIPIQGGFMRQTESLRRCLIAIALAMALLAWPAASRAQTVTGQATAAQATVIGLLGTTTTTTVSDTGTLGGTNDARDASLLTASIPSLLGGEVLSATTIGYPNEVDSAASLAGLNLNVAGVGVSADFVMAEASQVLGATGGGTSYIDNLSVNGSPMAVTGQPNQTVAIPGGQIVINEQTISQSGATVVNALHVIVNGVANVVIASATAGIS